MRRLHGVIAVCAPLLLAGCAHGPVPMANVSNIIIGGGMQHCSTTQGTLDQADKRCTASWRTILQSDPAFAGTSEKHVLFGPVKPAEASYAATAEALRALDALPQRLFSQASRERVRASLVTAPGPWTDAAFSAWLRGAGPLTPNEHAALRHAFAVPAAVGTRPRQLRSVAFSANQDTVAIYRAFVAAAAARAGGAQPTIALVTASADNPFNDHDIYASALRSAGAKVVWLPLDGGLRRALDAGDCDHLPIDYASYAQIGTVGRAFHWDRVFPDLAESQRQACAGGGAALNAALETAHGVFFTGGNQARHRDSLYSGAQASAQLAILQRRVAAGEMVVAGSSAGNAVQAGGMWRGKPVPMIAGGDPVTALLNGFKVAGAPEEERPGQRGSYHPQGGLGLFHYGPLDSHFSERAREGRLVRLAADTGMEYAFGVDENTALVVGRPDAAGITTMSVIGAAGVWVADLRKSQAGAILSGVRIHYLHAGDTLTIDRAGALTVSLAANGIGAGSAAPTPKAGLRLANLAGQLAASGNARAEGILGTCPNGAVMTLDRLPASRLGVTQRGALSYSGLALSIAPCPSAPSLALTAPLPHNWRAGLSAEPSD